MIRPQRPRHFHSMLAAAGAVFLCIAALSPAAMAQEAGFMQSGAALYEQNCTICHGETGAGQPPHFPALAGNEVMSDLARIVTNIHQGQGNMPPFPDLEAEEITALAVYVRNAWGNTAGDATVEEVASLIAGLDSAADRLTIWDGVYGSAQVARGRLVYDGQCAVCHGRRLNGAAEDPDMQSGPPLARANFLRDWNGRSLAVLFDYTRASMPQANPGSLTDEQYADILAYMLSVSGAPAGQSDLSDAQGGLARIVIVPEG